MGRWSSISIKGRDKTIVTIFSVYRVCAGHIKTAGPGTCFAQMWHLADMKNIQPNKPRQQVLDDLEEAIQKCRSQAHEVIVLMDANETVARNNSSIRKWMINTGLLDPITERHGLEGQPRTYARGSSRIDYIFITPGLYEYTTKCGILPLHNIIDSDHRALLIDIDLHRYLKGIPSAICTSSTRGIQSNNPRAVAKYQQILTDFIKTNHIIMDKMRQLIKANDEQQGLTPTQFEDFMRLETTISKAKLEAEQQVQHISAIPWSPRLLKAQKEVKYWRSWRLELRHGMDRSEYRLLLIPSRPQTEQPTIQEVTKQLQTATNNLQRIETNASEIRREHLQKLATMYANTGKTTDQQAIKQLIQSENLRDLYAKLRHVLDRTKSSSLRSILLNPPGSPDVEISDQAEMEDALNKHNTKHFSQADVTPFASPTIKQTYGRTGTNESSSRMLNGIIEVDQDGMLQATKDILHALRRVANDEIDITLTTEDMRSAHKAWRESTTTNRVYQEYLQERLSMTELEIASINWNAVAAATYSIPPTIKPFSVKLSIRWIATGTRCAKYGSLMHSCHLCDEPETHNHLFQCPQKQEEKSTYIKELREFLGTINTAPQITHALTTGIDA
jgi:hypothetical protein